MMRGCLLAILQVTVVCLLVLAWQYAWIAFAYLLDWLFRVL
jgi:hypothetical protein